MGIMWNETQILYFILRSASILTPCLLWPLGGMNCLKPDYYVLCLVLYRAGKTSRGQCHSVDPILTFLQEMEEFPPSESVYNSADTKPVHSLFSLYPGEYPCSVSYIKSCRFGSYKHLSSVVFTVLLSCLDKAPGCESQYLVLLHN